jgi:hypothetical protein
MQELFLKEAKQYEKQGHYTSLLLFTMSAHRQSFYFL